MDKKSVNSEILWLQSLACQSWPRNVSWIRCCSLIMQSICIIRGSKVVNSVHEHQNHVPTKFKDHSYFNEIGSPDCYTTRFAPVSLPLDKVFLGIRPRGLLTSCFGTPFSELVFDPISNNQDLHPPFIFIGDTSKNNYRYGQPNLISLFHIDMKALTY